MNQAEPPLDHARLPGGRPDVSEPDDQVSVETLRLGRDPTAPTHHWPRWPLAIVTVLSSIAALLMIGAHSHLEPGIVGALSTPLNILVLGDASGGREGCGGCVGYTDQFAAAMSEDGHRTHLDDKTVSGQATPPSMAALVADLPSIPEIRSSVETSDVVLLAVSSGDVNTCSRKRMPCPAKPIPQFRQSLTDWIAETEAIRHHRPVKLRVITPPPTSGSPRQNDVARTAFEIAAAHHATCVNVYALARTDEHIVAAQASPSHHQLTQHGHDLVAKRLIAIGLS